MLKNKSNHICVATFSLEEVIPFVFTDAKRNELRAQGYKYTDFEWVNASRKAYPIITAEIAYKKYKRHYITVAMGSHRYQLFALKGTDCVKCGIKGQFFALERSVCNDTSKFHFNLYGIDKDGYKMMITKDHIIPRSRGGKNTLDNYQPLCYSCNQRKANRIENVKS